MMLEVKSNTLQFSFPEIHPQAKFSMSLQRTLRVGEGQLNALPPNLGSFPIRHVDDHKNSVPPAWVEHGGVMVPMWQSEALWLNFLSDPNRRYAMKYPFAVKIAAGKINAITGEPWHGGLSTNQDYAVFPKQPWLDGFKSKEGSVRQFVAAPLGEGRTVEGQVTGREEFGGIQIVVYPMKAEEYERRCQPATRQRIQPRSFYQHGGMITSTSYSVGRSYATSPDMGLGAGGDIKQQIYSDEYGIECWDTTNPQRCFIHLCNSQGWQSITGSAPPTKPLSADDYRARNYPWYDWYDEGSTVPGSATLDRVPGVSNPVHVVSDHTPLAQSNVIVLGPGSVRVGEF